MVRVLIIEDNPSQRLLIRDALEEDHEIFLAEDGVSGLEKARQVQPDLVVCDIAMPGMDGFGVLEKLRNEPLLAGVPFIFLTAYDERHWIRKGMDSGADDYLTKPFGIYDLRTAINARLKKKQSQDEQFKQQLDELRHNITVALPHEVRTAIMVIQGYTYLLMDEHSSLLPEHASMLKSLGSYAERLHQLSEKFLWYTRGLMLKPGNNPVPNPTFADAVIPKAALDKAAQYGRERDLRIGVEPGEVMIPDDCMKRVVEELVENACKFSDPGTPIYVSAGLGENVYMLTVRDAGRGIPLEQLSKVGAFMQFERPQQEQTGTGLGLIVARQLVEGYGGSFGIHSAVDEGTSVNVHLPSPTKHGQGELDTREFPKVQVR
ncbi:MAG: hybrid sensor histidine kinase/response regulator [bacterium]|nr:hybrid sensor histidine kinase/response regulator [bacterium]